MIVYELLLKEHPKSLKKLDKWQFKKYGVHISIPTPKQKPTNPYPDDMVKIDNLNKDLSQTPYKQKRVI